MLAVSLGSDHGVCSHIPPFNSWTIAPHWRQGTYFIAVNAVGIVSNETLIKQSLVSVFRATVICITVAYIWIAIVLASAFGEHIEQSSNLMWNDYTGGSAKAGWCKAISLYVVCFPALDVVSAFPLNAITLGNSLLGALYGRRTHEYEVCAFRYSFVELSLTLLGHNDQEQTIRSFAI